jgi:hypothetical protein
MVRADLAEDVMAAQDGANREQGKRRANGFHRAAAVAAPLVRAAGAGRGFAEHRLLSVWPEIVGPELAAMCRPAEVSYRGRTQGLGATLVLAVEGAVAPDVEHMIPLLIERVNQVYGYRAVARVRLSQTAAPLTPPPAAHPPESPPTLDPPGGADISGVDDPDLRAALARLGSNISLAARRRRQDAEGRTT